jgi:transketolase
MKLKRHACCLVLSRQALPTIDRSKYAAAANVAKGGYILAEAKGGMPDVILIATGSEVALCLSAYETLTAEGLKVRVVSMPSLELFEEQPEAYREEVLPSGVIGRVTVEMAAKTGWDRYAGFGGAIIGMHSFGLSAPGAAVIEKFGFTTEKVVEEARSQAKRKH